jgi:hypothetical protein
MRRRRFLPLPLPAHRPVPVVWDGARAHKRDPGPERPARPCGSHLRRHTCLDAGRAHPFPPASCRDEVCGHRGRVWTKFRKTFLTDADRVGGADGHPHSADVRKVTAWVLGSSPMTKLRLASRQGADAMAFVFHDLIPNLNTANWKALVFQCVEGVRRVVSTTKRSREGSEAGSGSLCFGHVRRQGDAGRAEDVADRSSCRRANGDHLAVLLDDAGL